MATLTATLYRTLRAASRHTEIQSFTTDGTVYVVREVFTPWCSCTCPDFTNRRAKLLGDERLCKHAAFLRHALTEEYKLLRRLYGQMFVPDEPW